MKKIGELHWGVGRVFTILYHILTTSGCVRAINGSVVFHENDDFCGVIFSPFLANFGHENVLIVFNVI